MTRQSAARGTNFLTSYLARIDDIARRGGEREESYYPSLEALLTEAAAELGHRDVRVITIPKRTSSCQLDFQVWRGGRVVGYVEAKHPRCKLPEVIDLPQIKRYRDTFPNLLVTNFYELVLLRPQDQETSARVADVRTGLEVGRAVPVGDPAKVLDLLQLFFTGESPRFASADLLALALAERTRVLAERVKQVLEREAAGLPLDASDIQGGLSSFYRTFKHHLILNLTDSDFADLYAQTVAYGLLIARWRTEDGPFTRRAVFDAIPPPLGILRDLFRYIALGTPPPEIAWVIEDLVELLAAAPVPELLRRAYHESNGRDPVLHFYETFLARYDQALRKRRGVYYTPLPVVTYMVRSVHRLLETRLGLQGGLANPNTTLLDPAAGTLTFLVEAFRVAIESYRAEAGEGGLAQLVRDHLLPHFHGFELMMAPYVIGHLKMSLMLAEWGFPLADGQRVQLYLTDALEPEPLAQSSLPGIESLSRESHAAGHIKTEQPISVVLGNPPYSGKSANTGTWIRDLIVDGYRRPDGSRDEGYHRVDGAPLGERNPKWLQDDYVKFLRFAEWKIEHNGQGVAALVTNHGYLENPTFRGLRRSLMKTFDEIYLLDLGGSRFERDRSPEQDGVSERNGEPDENVFPEVSRGVVIALLVKLPPGRSTRACRVYTAALRGRRAGKARRLLEEDVATTAWSEITPRAASYRFRTGDAALEEEYLRGVPLDHLFPEHSAGVVTARDQLALAFDRQELIDLLHSFRGALPDTFLQSNFGARDTGTWRLAAARRAAREDSAWRDKLTTLLYRPFDHRHLLYADYLVERPRRRIMRHLLETGTPALIAPRQCKEPFGALVTAGLAGHKAVSAADINSVFPLYLEPEGLFGHREPNLAPGLLDQLGALHGALPTPEEVLAYVYALLYSPAYRSRYAGPLKRGFARVPFARNPAVFWQLARLGQELIDLHLERSPRLWPGLVRFCGAGDGTLGSEWQLRDYRPAERRVVVNAAGQAFEGIPPEVWDYRIGGTRVLPRWLAARAKRRLTLGEIDAFRRAATALHHTLELEKQLDGPALEAIRDPAVLENETRPVR